MENRIARPRRHPIAMLVSLPLVATLTMSLFVFAEDRSRRSAEQIAEYARAVWEDVTSATALEILDQGIHDFPDALTLQKLRADILSTSRGPREAIEAYETVLFKTPTAVDVRWASGRC